MKALASGRGSIRRKLFVGALAVGLVALLLTGAAFFTHDLHAYRSSSATNLAIQAELIGSASEAALQFDDLMTAAGNLAILRARKSIRAAAIYNPRGAVFASYLRPEVPESEIPVLPGNAGVAFDGDRIEVFHRVLAGREIIGTVYLAEDLGVPARVASYAPIALVVLLVALAISATLTAWVQKGITRPIIQISQLAQGVVDRRDYSVRARRTTDDEIGTLVDAFNEMLSEIERRTAAQEASAAEISQLNRDLERRVAERTTQLEDSNLRLQAADKAKSSFLSMMSHEIRTPMNGVLGMLELLALTELDAQQRTTLGIVRDSGRSLLRIIDDILDFSKIEAGKLEVRPEVASVSRVVAGVTAIYSGNASSKGVLLKSWCDPRISPAVRVDPTRLQQILNNLASNAIKFTAHGWVEIKAVLEERQEGIDVVRIAVTDTGVGISEQGQAVLFQPFMQANGDVARSFGGTGLGLSISRRLAELMGGRISISSRVGQGTVATVTLPLPVADPALLPVVEDLDASAAQALGGLLERRPAPSVAQAQAEGTLVLVVDDHPVNRMLLSRQVTVLGYAHETAEDGRQALALWQTGRFTLVLTDCNMPRMSGYDLAREIRSREKALARPATVVIACTANALAGEAENCFAAGMNDYIAKPVELNRLAAKLDRWLLLPPATPRARAGLPAPSIGDPIDREVMNAIVDGDAVLEREILEQFARANAEDMSALRQAVEACDVSRTRQAAHRIKGAAGSIGAVGVAEAAGALECAAHAADRKAVAEEHERLVEQVERLSQHTAKVASR